VEIEQKEDQPKQKSKFLDEATFPLLSFNEMVLSEG
jgi:hypothetical protein